jgi:uncharacterized protein YpmB
MRAIEKKRPPFMTVGRWSLLIVVVVLLLIAGITLFYRVIHENIWQQESGIKQVITQSEAYDLETTESLYKYVWEKTYWILLASDQESKDLTYSAWEGEGHIAELAYDDALSAEDMLAIVQRTKAKATDINLQVGYGLGQFVWEVKYRDSETSHMKIAFYSLTNGILIDEYTIPQNAMLSKS